MSTRSQPTTAAEFEGLDAELGAQLATFELFFKTFGFKRVHGRVWGLLVLAGQPLSSREIGNELELSQGATSMAINELEAWGAIASEFDSTRRCHVHRAESNTLSIIATVFRRREQVVFGKFKQTSQATLDYIRKRYGEKDPRVFTLRSIISSCEIAEAVMHLVFSSVERALGDGESLLAKAVTSALKMGVRVPARLAAGKDPRAQAELAAALLAKLPPDDDHDVDEGDDGDDGEEEDATKEDRSNEPAERPATSLAISPAAKRAILASNDRGQLKSHDATLDSTRNSTTEGTEAAHLCSPTRPSLPSKLRQARDA